ncbi:hypothetical protein CS8_094540 [Cupriavidus sp. 8B]
MLANQRQPHLPQQLVLQPDLEILGPHLRKRPEEQAPGGGDDRVHPANAFEQGLHRLRPGQVDPVLAARLSHPYHFMASRQVLCHRLAERSAGSDHNNFHRIPHGSDCLG